jgi:D-amino-acid dehydrogenase
MDVIVVGGGIVGASAAFHLSRAGASVVVVDRADAGRATDAGAGIVCPWLASARDPAWHRIARAAAAYYPELLGHLAGADLGHAPVGAAFVVPAGEQAPLVDRAMRLAGEIPQMGAVRALEPGEPRQLFPVLREDYAGVFIPGGARVDGRLMNAALTAAATGVRFRTGSASLVLEGERAVGVDVAGERLLADEVIAAAGAWTSELYPVPVAPQRGQICHFGIDTETAEWPVVQPVGGHYLLAFPGGRVVCGATRETGAGFDYRLTAAGVAEVLTEAITVAPGLGPATLLETRIGFRPASVDDLPLLGRVRPGLIVATGLGATGLTMGPYTGLLAAEIALGEPPRLDLAPYNPARQVG